MSETRKPHNEIDDYITTFSDEGATTLSQQKRLSTLLVCYITFGKNKD
jgi:hypothetical protein